MIKRTLWVERKFNFDFPEGWIYNIIERLRGTPARLYDIIYSISDEDAGYKPNEKWSIKEHIGHLIDLEDLHDGRIDDFKARLDTLRAADMTNAKTYSANHNEKSVPQLLQDFSKRRKLFVAHLEQIDDETHLFKSIHPRLQIPMRPVDMAYFTAEHDDHHIASIRAILVHNGY